MTIHKVLFITLLFFIEYVFLCEGRPEWSFESVSCEMDLVSGRPDTAKHFYFIPEKMSY